MYLSSVRYAMQHPLLTWSAAITLVLMLATRWFEPQNASSLQVLLPTTALLLLWLAWELYRGVIHFWTAEHRNERSYSSWLGLGFALLGGCALLLRLTGGLSSSFYPLFYLAVAFLTSVGTARQGTYWLGYALVLEAAAVMASMATVPTAVSRGALHLVFLGLFAGSHHLYLHGLLWDMRRLRNRKNELSDMTSRAPAFSRDSASTPVGLTATSIQSLDAEREMLFSLLREGLDAHGCTLLWMDDVDKTYEVYHIDSQSDDIEHGPFSLQTGAPAGLFQRHNPMRISRSGDSGIHLPYYGRSVAVRSWLAVPIVQGQRVRGALCADRIHRTPFSAREESMMEGVAMIFGRALESQRSFLHSRREPQSILSLYEAGLQLNKAHSEGELGQTALDMASQLAEYDWGLVTRYHTDDDTHTVIATHGDADSLIQRTFSVEKSQLALALKNGCPLPHKGLMRSNNPLIATEDPELPDFASVTVIPLRMLNQPVGSLVLASQDPQMFADDEREKNLGTLAHHLAALLENARHQQFREQLAEKDHLTQLANHRTLMEQYQELFEEAKQLNKRLSVLVVDIDRFQDINTKYGYESGDRVLTQVARFMERLGREIDIVARFEGDEFVMVLDEANHNHALKVADRLLAQVSNREFCAEGESPELFSVTLSIGVATYPEGATEPVSLLMGAKDALLQAKQRGGHRVVLYSSPSSGAPHQAPFNVSRMVTQPPPGWGWASSSPLPFARSEHEIVHPEESLNQRATRAPFDNPGGVNKPVSVSHIIEAVIKSNRSSSKEDLLGVPDLESLSMPRNALQELPDEPPYPDSSDEMDEVEHDSTAFLAEHMEVSYHGDSESPEMEASPLHTPAPPQGPEEDPIAQSLPRLPAIDDPDADKVG